MLLVSICTILLVNSAHARVFGLLSTERPKISFIPFTSDQRVQVAKQAKDLFSIYVNRESKLENYGRENPLVDPLPRVDSLLSNAANLTDQDFHYQLTDIFTTLRDFHTLYSMPGPHACFRAVSGPRFKIVDGGSADDPIVIVEGVSQDKYIQQLSPELSKITFGDRLLKVDGQSFPQYFESNKYSTGGANLYGGQRSALYRLAVVSGGYGPMPKNDTITFDFQSAKTGQSYQVTLPWVVIRTDPCYREAVDIIRQITGAKPLADNATLTDSSLSSDATVKRYTVKQSLRMMENVHYRSIQPFLPPKRRFKMDLKDTKSSILKWEIYRPEKENLGIIRLESFSPEDTSVKALILTIRGLLLKELKDTKAVVFDIRGNPGGFVDLADGIPQLFVPNFKAGRSRAIVAPINDYLFQNATDEFSKAYLGTSKAEKYSTPASLSQDFNNNYYGNVYFKPIGIFNDAECYSACDLFSANMQDSGAAIIFGEDGQSGAGGANVVNTRDYFPAVAPKLFPTLPFVGKSQDAPEIAPSISLGWRQLVRVGKNQGKLIEDIGIKTDVLVRPIIQDFSPGQTVSTQWERISKTLDEKSNQDPKYKVFFSAEPQVDGTSHLGSPLLFDVSVGGLDRLEIVDPDGKILLSERNLSNSKNNIQLSANTSVDSLIQRRYTFQGYLGSELVLRTNRYIRYIPSVQNYLPLNSSYNWNFEMATFSTVYDSMTTPTNAGWKKTNESLTIGDGNQYADLINSRASIFVKTSNATSISLKVDASYVTELALDFFRVGYVHGKETVYLTPGKTGSNYEFGLSGTGVLNETFSFTPNSTEIEVFLEFISDEGNPTSYAGVNVKEFKLSVA